MLYTINEETITGIADAIREKKGYERLLSPGAMAGEIRSIVGGDLDIGKILDGTIGLSAISSDCTSVRDYAMYRVTAFESLDLPEATTIGINAFYQNTALKTANLPKVTSFKTSSLQGCTALEQVTAAPTEIGDYAFDGCSRMTGSISFENTTKIGAYAFRNCTSLVFPLEFPKLTSLINYSFQSCIAQEVRFPKLNPGSSCLRGAAFEKIVCGGTGAAETYAFANTDRLRVLDLAISILGTYACYNCTALETVILRRTAGVVTVASNAFKNTPETMLVYVPDELVESYRANAGWSSFGERIRGISELEEDASA